MTADAHAGATEALPDAQHEQEARPEQGGDPACWLERVCSACGALADGPPAPVCARCGSVAPVEPV